MRQNVKTFNNSQPDKNRFRKMFDRRCFISLSEQQQPELVYSAGRLLTPPSSSSVLIWIQGSSTERLNPSLAASYQRLPKRRREDCARPTWTGTRSTLQISEQQTQPEG